METLASSSTEVSTSKNTPNPSHQSKDKKHSSKAKASLVSSGILITNEQFVQLEKKISSQPIPWEGYYNANLISEEDMHLFRSLTQQKNRFIHRPEFTSYLLVMIDEILKISDETNEYCLSFSNESNSNIFSLFERLLVSSDEFTRLKSLLIITRLLIFSKNDKSLEYDYSKIFSVLSDEIDQETGFSQDVSIQLIQSLLDLKPPRQYLFFENPDCLEKMCKILKLTIVSRSLTSASVSTSQTQYQIGYCLWLLSFDPIVCESLNSKYDVVHVMTRIARSTLKEKVTRIMISTLKNLYLLAMEYNLPSIIASGVHGCLVALKSRKIQDVDLENDIDQFMADLGDKVSKISTWDEYKSQVKCGMLSWTPEHSSDVFWKMNYMRMNENEFEVLKLLSGLLKTRQDSIVLAVAIHDIGQYIKYYPDGKSILSEIGAKYRTMQLMTHEDSQVRFEALNTVQTFMMNAWKNAPTLRAP
ncbi:hypothetical protein BB560_003507 [Smittium megazygosporum]|uniref:V-type proton ATPase subunit H n=1 Tax=Smittium megazygosporum TaxID=133381 RepID=A0A2T9ZBT1_9FUNG|nr:hypothetical protein BB560_003507 [Smittium megazygosporum]